MAHQRAHISPVENRRPIGSSTEFTTVPARNEHTNAVCPTLLTPDGLTVESAKTVVIHQRRVSRAIALPAFRIGKAKRFCHPKTVKPFAFYRLRNTHPSGKPRHLRKLATQKRLPTAQRSSHLEPPSATQMALTLKAGRIKLFSADPARSQVEFLIMVGQPTGVRAVSVPTCLIRPKKSVPVIAKFIDAVTQFEEFKHTDHQATHRFMPNLSSVMLLRDLCASVLKNIKKTNSHRHHSKPRPPQSKRNPP